MHDQSNPVKTVKKQYQKPDFWVLDSYVEGGAGAHVNEATARNHSSTTPAKPGNAAQIVYKAGHTAITSVNWTAAHS